MVDSLTPKKRSWNMSQIKGKDTSIEIKVRKYLFSLGFRYRLHDSRLPGKPDIILPKHSAVIFVNGCFWHRHPGCPIASTPKTNTEFWQKKFNHNTLRDSTNTKKLLETGWRVYTIWQCDIEKRFDQTMSKLVEWILNYEAEKRIIE